MAEAATPKLAPHPAASRACLKTVTVLERSGKFTIHRDVTLVALGEWPTIYFAPDRSIQYGQDTVAAINTYYDGE